MTHVLLALIEKSALPLRTVEVYFAVDSTGFSTNRYDCWFEYSRDKENKKEDKKENRKREFLKCHLICGVKTNVVATVVIGNYGDSVCLPGLVKNAAKSFDIQEVSADKGYPCPNNADAIAAVGGTPFIMPKIDSFGGGSDAWGQMFHYFKFHEAEFLEHYHKRSNAETTFSMIKRKFGTFVRSKSDTGMINEVLCKVLCHNLVVLNHEMLELKIDPTDWGGTWISSEKKPVAEPSLTPDPAVDTVTAAPSISVPTPPASDSTLQVGGLIRRGLRSIAQLILRAV
jgi:transposase